MVFKYSAKHGTILKDINAVRIQNEQCYSLKLTNIKTML